MSKKIKKRATISIILMIADILIVILFLPWPFGIINIIAFISIIYWINKKTKNGYEMARKWIGAFLLFYLIMGKFLIDTKNFSLGLIMFAIDIFLIGITFYLVDLICKELASQK